MKYLGKFINGYAFPSSSFQSSGTRVLKIANIQPMKISWEDESFVDEKYEALVDYIVEKGDLVFALTRPIINGGIKTAIADFEYIALLNQRNAMFKGGKGITKQWQFYLMQNDLFVQEFAKYIDGTGQQPNISTKEISDIAIPLPPIDIQDGITNYLNDKCSHIDRVIKVTQKTIIRMVEYKKSLIYEVVTGKLEV
jgi:type I restriction enzyme S subunit